MAKRKKAERVSSEDEFSSIENEARTYLSTDLPDHERLYIQEFLLDVQHYRDQLATDRHLRALKAQRESAAPECGPDTKATLETTARREAAIFRCGPHATVSVEAFLKHIESHTKKLLNASESDRDVLLAKEMLRYVGGAREAISRGDPIAAVDAGVSLGLVLNRECMILYMEDYASTGKKIKRAAQAGHEAVHGTPAKKAERWRKYFDVFRRQWKPGSKRGPAYRKVARQFGVNAETVARAVRRLGEP